MPIKLNGQPLNAYKGDYAPVNIYRGANKLAGWRYDEKTGASLSFSNTYNDYVDRLEIEGKSIQDGTPTPTTPIDIESVDNFNLIVNDNEISMPYVLRSLPNGLCDKLVVDKTTPIPSAWIERKVQFYEDADSRRDWGYEINEIEPIPHQDIATIAGTTVISTDSTLQPSISAKVKIIDT